MNIAILGFGSQGAAALDYLNTKENTVKICDANKVLDAPNGIATQLGESYLTGLDQYDLLVRTPFLHPRDILAANPDNPEILDKVTTVTNEFITVCPSRNIIGVTGTKGKGTTSTLIAKMLEAAGKRVHLGGNIGLAPLEMLKGAGALDGKDDGIQADDWVVLELANFQLIDLKQSPHIAVCLMIEPEHLDWHEDMEEYIAAKQQLFMHQSESDIAIYYADNETSLDIAAASEGELIPYYEEPGAIVQNNAITIDGNVVCDVHEIKLLGKHNWQNVCAAVTTVWQITQDVTPIRQVATSFTGLEHRLELVKVHNEVSYYDDSFGTTPATAIVAIEAFTQPKVIILGGSDKGATFKELAKTVANSNVRAVITIGITGPGIGRDLKSMNFKNVIEGADTMSAIVEQARAATQPGDVVLLSTACASFDMFENYKDRGEKFAEAVKRLV